MGRVSLVVTATRYGLDGVGIFISRLMGSRWARDFPHPSKPALGPTQPTTKQIPYISLG